MFLTVGVFIDPCGGFSVDTLRSLFFRTFDFFFESFYMPALVYENQQKRIRTRSKNKKQEERRSKIISMRITSHTLPINSSVGLIKHS
jgi:hypothetical protein